MGKAETSMRDARSPVVGGGRRGAWSWWIVAGMVLLWIAVVLSRNTIRAHWWVHRLAAAESTSARLAYFHRLASLGDRAVPAVARLLESQDAGLRSFAVGVLHHAPGDDAFRLLARASRDEDPDVARIALQGLGVRADESSVSELAAVAVGGDQRRAMMAVMALSETRAGSAEQVLGDLVRTSPHVGVRVEAIAGLKRSGTRHAVGVLIAALEDDAVYDGVLESGLSAARAFAAAGADSAVRLGLPADVSVHTDGNHVVWRSAARALRTITGHSCGLAEDADRSTTAEAWRAWWRGIGVPENLPSP